MRPSPSVKGMLQPQRILSILSAQLRGFPRRCARNVARQPIMAPTFISHVKAILPASRPVTVILHTISAISRSVCDIDVEHILKVTNQNFG
jgi:hypothetical protein